MLNKKQVIATVATSVVIIGGVVAAVMYRKKLHIYEDEEAINPEVDDESDIYRTTTKVALSKPSLDEISQVRTIAKSMGYSVDKNENKPEIEKAVEELSPHICTEEDYVSTYTDFDHCTCTWYPDEKRLVNLDHDFEIMTPIHEYIGSIGEKVLLEKKHWADDFVMYAVNPVISTVYEILVNTETGYLEDLDYYMTAYYGSFEFTKDNVSEAFPKVDNEEEGGDE